jgi:PAS domain S-box-containing protein
LTAELVSENRGYLFEDNAGTLWSGGETLSRLEAHDGKISFSTVPLNLPPIPQVRFGIEKIFGGRDGSLWLVTTHGLVRRLADGRIVFYALDPTQTDRPTSALEDAGGKIWIGRSSGVYVINPESAAELGAFTGVLVRRFDTLAVEQPQNNPVLPQRPGEIFKFAELEGFTERNATFLYQTSDGRIWISAGNGLIEFDGQRFRLNSAAQGFGPGLGNMIEDPDGNLWMTWSNGVKRLDRRGFTSFTEQDGIKTPTLTLVGQALNGDIYSVSSDFQTNIIDDKGVTVARPSIPLTARPLWTANLIFQDHLGEWWVLTNEKLYRYAATTDLRSFGQAQPVAAYDQHNGLKGSEAQRIFEDSHHDLWIVTRDADNANFGLTRYDRAANAFRTFSEAEGYPSRILASSFVEDRQGNLWIGIYEGGLLKYADGRFTSWSKVDGVPDGVITSLLIDARGRLWLVSSMEGLSRIDDPATGPSQLVHVSRNDGQTSNNIRTLAEDNFGNIYAGTARGIDRYSPDGAQSRHFSVNDGLAGDFVVSSVKDRAGNMWFATSSGLSKLVPESEAPTAAPPVLFSGLRVAGEDRPVPQLGATELPAMELAPAQNNLQIDFFAIDFHPNESLRYQFKLEGADADWSAPTEQRTVNFANLSSGSYRFLVRTVNADGIVGQHPATIAFRVLTPIWRRWWFLALVIGLVGAAVFALDRYRLAKTTQVKNALAKSIESETRFRTLAGTASDAIITIDVESRIVFVNEAVEKTFGYSPAELIGENLTILMPENLQPEHENGLRRYASTNQRRIGWSGAELPGRHKSGAVIPLELSFGEFALNGERFFTGVARDITERKKAAEALQRSREERLAELERVRHRIARDLHDDVGSSLTQIALFSEVAKQNQTGNAEAARPLEQLIETSNELVEAMSDIVWAINPLKDHLLDLAQRMRRFAAESLTAAGIDLEFSAPTADVAMGANMRREVFLIFKESINNIVKHSAATRVRVDFAVTDTFLTLVLEDNGRGFDAAADQGAFDWETSSGGNGLQSMARRATELGGE